MKLKEGEFLGFENNCHGLKRWQIEQLNEGMDVDLENIPKSIEDKFQKKNKKGSKK